MCVTKMLGKEKSEQDIVDSCYGNALAFLDIYRTRQRSRHNPPRQGRVKLGNMGIFYVRDFGVVCTLRGWWHGNP